MAVEFRTWEHLIFLPKVFRMGNAAGGSISRFGCMIAESPSRAVRSHISRCCGGGDSGNIAVEAFVGKFEDPGKFAVRRFDGVYVGGPYSGGHISPEHVALIEPSYLADELRGRNIDFGWRGIPLPKGLEKAYELLVHCGVVSRFVP